MKTQEAKINFGKDHKAYFSQGRTKFEVHPTDLGVTLGTVAGTRSVLDGLTPAALRAMAAANGLPTEPFSREALKAPLHGVVQDAWLRSTTAEGVPERVRQNQARRVESYLRHLAAAARAPGAVVKSTKEEDTVSKEKKKKVPAKAKGKKGAARDKGPKANGAAGFGAQNVVLACRRAPKDGEVPPQAAAILGLLRKAGRLTPGELVAQMEGKIELRPGSKQTMRAVLNLHRSKLQAAGLLEVRPAEAAKAA
jgi:hypothetical protein